MGEEIVVAEESSTLGVCVKGSPLLVNAGSSGNRNVVLVFFLAGMIYPSQLFK